MTKTSGSWAAWLKEHHQPVLFAFGGDWSESLDGPLDAIRDDLGGLGALLVVASAQRAFCLIPDEEPVAVPLLDGPGLDELRRVLGIELGAPAARALTLTLVDERRVPRMQATWSSAEQPEHVVAAVLDGAWQSLFDGCSSVAESVGRSLLHSARRELMTLTLLGAPMPHASSAA